MSEHNNKRQKKSYNSEYNTEKCSNSSDPNYLKLIITALNTNHHIKILTKYGISLDTNIGYTKLKIMNQ